MSSQTPAEPSGPSFTPDITGLSYDEFLKACDKSVAVSRYVGRDEER